MKVELIYFDLQGRATQTRIMLKMAGIEFTDTRLSKEEFMEKKASFPLGQLPVLKVNDKVRDSLDSKSCYSWRTWSDQVGCPFLNPFKVFCQSDAIMEWAAEKAGLIPKNDEDAMAMRMVIGKTHIKYVILMSSWHCQLLSYKSSNRILRNNQRSKNSSPWSSDESLWSSWNFFLWR